MSFIARQRPRALFRHLDTFLSLPDTSVDRRFDRPFCKTYDYAGDFIDRQHQSFITCPERDGMIDIGIDGWLLPDDAMKLYEMAYFSNGNILELGTYRGLGTSIIASAVNAAGSVSKIISVDIDPEHIDHAKISLQGRPGWKQTRLIVDDANAAIAGFSAKNETFGFAFVDHSHRFEDMIPTCQRLRHIVSPSGFALFHDFNDPRNPDPNNDDYGVYQAVTYGLDQQFWEFWGIYGCAALYRRTW